MPAHNRKEKIADAIVVACVMLLAFGYVFPTVRDVITGWNRGGVPTWVKRDGFDPDTFLIHGGLVMTPHFRDTLRWWTGAWVGQIPFYRPLSSQVFWIEWKLVGDHETRLMLFSILFHLLAVYQFTRLALCLFRYFRCPLRHLATLTAGSLFVDGLGFLGNLAAFAVGRNYASNLAMIPIRQMTTRMITIYWKNQPDSLCTLFCCLALRIYINALDELTAGSALSPTNASDPTREADLYGIQRLICALRTRLRGRREGAVVAAYLSGCLCKEAGVFLPLLLVWIEAPALFAGKGEERRAALWRLAPVLLAIPVFLLVRSLCLRGAVGFLYGSNHAWVFRLLSYCGGPVLEGVAVRDWPALGLSFVMLCLILTLIRCRRISLPGVLLTLFGAFGALILMGVIAFANVSDAVPDSSITDHAVMWLFLCITPQHLVPAIQIVLFCVAFLAVFRFRPLLGLFCYSWVLVTLGPTLLSPSPQHRYYLIEGGYALMVASGWMLAGQFSSMHATATSTPSDTR